jgi:hypothetical protein
MGSFEPRKESDSIMVERITAEALIERSDFLASKGILAEGLLADLRKLIAAMDSFSNWTEAGNTIRNNQIETLSGNGPVSKFLRTLAYGLERISEEVSHLEEKSLKVTKILISKASAGCSDYEGQVEILCENPAGETLVLASGGFLWDCAAHGMSQPQAAQELGYRCMVNFPGIAVPAH